MMKSIVLLAIVVAVLQVRGDETAFEPFEGSGNTHETLLTDDEDFEGVPSGSGMITTPESESPTIETTTETITETTPDYEDEPEISSTDFDEEDNQVLQKPKINLEELEKELDEKESELDDLEKELGIIGGNEKEEENESDETLTGKEELEVDIEADIEIAPKPRVPVEAEVTTTTKVITEEPKKVKDEEEQSNTDTEEVGDPSDVGLEEKQPPSDKEPVNASIFGSNQFLVAIIIGGCIGLLFAVCVILLVVYRLKKKDEGSYALDEQKKLASPSYQYTQGQEYFA